MADADTIAESYPFPRESDLTGKRPAELRAMGLTPPFHGKCRCDVNMLWRGRATMRAPGADATFVPNLSGRDEWLKKHSHWGQEAAKKELPFKSKVYRFVKRSQPQDEIGMLKDKSGDIIGIARYDSASFADVRIIESMANPQYDVQSVSMRMWRQIGNTAVKLDKELFIHDRIGAETWFGGGWSRVIYPAMQRGGGTYWRLQDTRNLRPWIKRDKALTKLVSPKPTVAPIGPVAPARTAIRAAVPPAPVVEQSVGSVTIDAMPVAERSVARRKILAQMTDEKLSPGMLNNLENGTSHMTTEMLMELRRTGLRIEYERIASNRVYYTTNGRVHLQRATGPNDIAHEFSHALDSYMATGGRGYSANLGGWLDNSFTSSSDGFRYRSWYQQRIASRDMGTIARSRETYFKDNWMDSYEGLFSGHGTGNEWWGMNSARYNSYCLNRTAFDRQATKISKWFTEGTTTKDLDIYLNSHFGGPKSAPLRSWAKGEMSFAEAQEAFSIYGPKGWGRVRQRYPELAELMERVYQPNVLTNPAGPARPRIL